MIFLQAEGKQSPLNILLSKKQSYFKSMYGTQMFIAVLFTEMENTQMSIKLNKRINKMWYVYIWILFNHKYHMERSQTQKEHIL